VGIDLIITKRLETLKTGYYQWRYWNYIYRNMKRLTDTIDNQSPYISRPGISFSFDDSFRIGDWYKYGKDIFGFYDVKVTFNINAVNNLEGGRPLKQSEVDMLLDLQANGHEIAHHGYKHKNAIEFSAEQGIEQWVEDEIESLFKWMEKQSHSITKERFRKPVTYAFPYFKYNEKVLAELINKYYKIARGHLNGNNLLAYNHTGFAPSLCIDSHLLSDPRNMRKILRFAKQAGSNLILTCHSILPEDVTWEELGIKLSPDAGKWRTSPKVIKAIIKEAKRIGLEFYTTSEIAGVATFIDPHFEQCVRRNLKNSSVKWISIQELSEIRELDLSYKGISNLDGIQYFTNLEKLTLKGNNVSDFRLLKKLPKLKEKDIKRDMTFREKKLCR
jgi:peptidoglycan/xylan/chitin deacetylase (PgdA/CDA1 family)